MALLEIERKTPNQIVQLAIDNNCVNEVYDLLHNIMMDKIKYLKDKSSTLSAEKKLIKKFADVDKLDAIKTILEDEEEKEK